MDSSKGSVIILVLVITSAVIILGSALASITHTERIMSNMYKNHICAQYISEAGIGRSVSVIEKNIKDRIKGVLEEAKILERELYNQDPRPTAESAKMQLYDFILNEVNGEIRDYFKDKRSGVDCFNEDIREYKKGDSLMFTEANGAESYYTLNVSIYGNVSDRIIKIESVGYMEDSSKTIIAYYKIQDVEIVDVEFPVNSGISLDIQNDGEESNWKINTELSSYKLNCKRWIE